MKKAMISFACIFGVLTIILYFASLNHLDSSSARLLGTDTTINIQGTVFCAACAIICAINIVGAMILTFLESGGGSSVSGASNPLIVPKDQKTEQDIITEKEKNAEIEKKREQEEKPFSVNSFLSEIESEDSVAGIAKVWKSYKLNLRYPSIETYLTKYKEQEAAEGHLDNLPDIKRTIRELLGE